MFRVSKATLVLLMIQVTAATESASAQLVELRSVPVASGDQFLIHPSERLGMGGPSITLRDRWMDPFVNPAKGALLTESAFFLSPTTYGISGDNGAGRTLPLSGLFTADNWFGGMSLALQQIENQETTDFFLRPGLDWVGLPRRLDESAARNVYLQGFTGRRLGQGGTALGGSLAYASLGAVDGVDLLYQGSDGIRQKGHVLDARAGLYGTDAKGRNFELLLLHRRFEMKHEVRYIEWRWIPGERPELGRSELFVREVTEREE
jgi:hypothetical protein